MNTKPANMTTVPPLPDPPQRDIEDATSFKHLAITGNVHFLARYLGKPETTLIGAERYMTQRPGSGRTVPDLFVAFDVDPQAYEENNGYYVSVQGKPPDFVLEIASPVSGEVDTVDKPKFYAALGIPEYWRFDETGDYHGVRLAGDRLVDGVYQSIEIETMEDGSLQGHSKSLGLNLRWKDGQLGWYDPVTGLHIPTFEEERRGRLAAEARVRELEAELARRSRQT